MMKVAEGLAFLISLYAIFWAGIFCGENRILKTWLPSWLRKR